MLRNNTYLSDAEWEAKFNGPRDRLLKKIFGDSENMKKTEQAVSGDPDKA